LILAKHCIITLGINNNGCRLKKVYIDDKTPRVVKDKII